MSLQGTWKMTHHWKGAPPYSFTANFRADGVIDLPGFLGTWTQLGQSNQVALAIGDSRSITSYVGNVLGGAMGGEMTGAGAGSGGMPGEWIAVRLELVDAAEGAHQVPGQ